MAGLGKSLEKGSGTRSGLLWEVERLLNECESDVRFKLPQVLLMENVKNLLSAKHKPHFDKWCEYLETKGYKNYYQVMNAKNYGIPQNRERVFMVSVLGNYKYTFPKPIELTTTMKDFIEDKVDDRYYITSDKAKALVDKLILGGKLPVPKVGGGSRGIDLCTENAKTKDLCNCIKARYTAGITNFKDDNSGVCKWKKIENRYGK